MTLRFFANPTHLRFWQLLINTLLVFNGFWKNTGKWQRLPNSTTSQSEPIFSLPTPLPVGGVYCGGRRLITRPGCRALLQPTLPQTIFVDFRPSSKDICCARNHYWTPQAKGVDSIFGGSLVRQASPQHQDSKKCQKSIHDDPRGGLHLNASCVIWRQGFD